MATIDVTDPQMTLAALLDDRLDLAAVVAAIFDYTQYLLDDDERLTKSGALGGRSASSCAFGRSDARRRRPRQRG